MSKIKEAGAAERIVVYVMTNPRNPKELGFQETVFPKSYFPPATATISVYNEQTGEYEQRRIRYAPGEKDIEVEKQSKNARKNITDLEFRDGFLEFDKRSKPLLHKYLMALNINESNPNRDTTVRPMIKVLNPSDVYQKAMKQEKDKSSVFQMFSMLPVEKKRALSHFMGKPTMGFADDSEWLWRLFKLVTKNDGAMRRFMEDVKNPVLDKIDVVSRAVMLDIMKFDRFEWTLDGNVIMKVDRTANEWTEIASFLTANKETWANLQSRVNDSTKEIIGEEAVLFTEDDAEALIEKGKDAEVITYSVGKGFVIEGMDDVSYKSKKAFVSALTKDPSLRKEVIDAVG